MFPKQIILQSTSPFFLNLINTELSGLPSIRYNYIKINNLYTISIKCSNYYKKFSNTNSTSFYGSYIFLYTNISLILAQLIIFNYEHILIKREIKNNYFYFDNTEQRKIFNIASSILDPAFPSNINKNLFMYRKETILNELLKNFKYRNYLNVDAFVNFSLKTYKKEIQEAVDKAVELFISDVSYIELIKIILSDLLF